LTLGAGTDTLSAAQQEPEHPMAARSMASLNISFGMVSIPVDLYTATVSSEKISFNLLHAKDG
jgi:hypothetical protein